MCLIILVKNPNEQKVQILKKIPGWVKVYRRNHVWFKSASETLELLWQARGGGALASTLAGVTAVGKLIDSLYPAEGSWEKLQSIGLIEMDYAVGGYLCDVLIKSNLPKHLVSASLSSQAWTWFDEDGAPFVGCVYSGNQFLDGPFIVPGKEVRFLNLIRETVWADNTELMLSSAKHEAHHWKSSGKFRTEPIGKLTEYLGSKPVKWYVDRLKKYQVGPRTIMFAGPTGIGKSILARHIGANISNNQRTLKISSEVLQEIRSDELLSIVKTLQPTVLLLDDLNLKEEKNTQKFLAVLESLREPNSLVIVTLMTSHKEKPKQPKRGVWHFPGMRPDRIDEIFVLGLPEEEERVRLLKHYASKFGLVLTPTLLSDLKVITQDLSGAYIMELVRRISVHGIGSWKEEAENILLVAPNPDGEEETSEETPKEAKKSRKKSKNAPPST